MKELVLGELYARVAVRDDLARQPDAIPNRAFLHFAAGQLPTVLIGAALPSIAPACRRFVSRDNARLCNEGDDDEELHLLSRFLEFLGFGFDRILIARGCEVALKFRTDIDRRLFNEFD